MIPSDFTLSSTKPRLLVINFIFCRPLLFELILNSHQIHVKHGTSYSVRNFPLWSNFFSILFYHSLCKASIVACRRLIVLTARSFNFATRTSRNSFRSIYQHSLLILIILMMIDTLRSMRINYVHSDVDGYPCTNGCRSEVHQSSRAFESSELSCSRQRSIWIAYSTSKYSDSTGTFRLTHLTFLLFVFHLLYYYRHHVAHGHAGARRDGGHVPRQRRVCTIHSPLHRPLLGVCRRVGVRHPVAHHPAL